MYVFDQSHQANWFNKVHSRQILTKGISESGPTILNKTGIYISRSTQNRDFVKFSSDHDKQLSEFISETCTNKSLQVLMSDVYKYPHKF